MTRRSAPEGASHSLTAKQDYSEGYSPALDLEHLLDAACRLDAVIDMMVAGELYPEWSVTDHDIRWGYLRMLSAARHDLQAAGV